MDDTTVVNDAIENDSGNGNCGTGLSEEKVSILNLLPVQKVVSFSSSIKPYSIKQNNVCFFLAFQFFVSRRKIFILCQQFVQ